MAFNIKNISKYPIRNSIFAIIVTFFIFIINKLGQGLGDFLYPLIFVVSYLLFATYLVTVDDNQIMYAIKNN